jgi:hypothetical protein
LVRKLIVYILNWSINIIVASYIHIAELFCFVL